MPTLVTGPALKSGGHLRPLLCDFMQRRFDAGEFNLDTRDAGDASEVAANGASTPEAAEHPVRTVEFFVDADVAIASAISAGGSVRQTVQSWVYHTERWLRANVEGEVDQLILDASLVFNEADLVERQIGTFTGVEPNPPLKGQDRRLQTDDPYIRMVAKSIVDKTEALRATQVKLDLFKQKLPPGSAQRINLGNRMAAEEDVLDKTISGAVSTPIILRGPETGRERPDDAEIARLRDEVDRLERRLVGSEARAARREQQVAKQIDALNTMLEKREIELKALQAELDEREAAPDPAPTVQAVANIEPETEPDMVEEVVEEAEASAPVEALHEPAATSQPAQGSAAETIAQLKADIGILETALAEGNEALDQLYMAYVKRQQPDTSAVSKSDQILHMRAERHRREITVLKEMTLVSRERVSWIIARPVRVIELLVERMCGWDARRQKKLVQRSGYFDAAWYKRAYPDVAAAGMEPFEHFLKHGLAENRDPGPHFSSLRYLQENPDVAQSGAQPFLHYLTCGVIEGRVANDSAIKTHG